VSGGYAGDLTPQEAWALLEADPEAVLVDVRTEAEWQFVGLPDTSPVGRRPVLVEWNTADGPNESFLHELAGAGVPTDTEHPVLFLCRSGVRSVSAARTATEAGMARAYNITDGFEGGLDEQHHRGSAGWRASGLPWRQS
jgi:rhodanese-related sulfurtransferase